MKEAMFWNPESGGGVRCGLCAHRCLIGPGRRGICNVRENRGGTLYSLVYERLVSEAVDPIEKKPLYHFLPGSESFSMATRGCNFRCLHCQNCEISQMLDDESFDGDRPVPPRQIVQSAIAFGCRSVSYTYTEPTIFFEYAYDTARMAVQRGLKNVFVTNGYIAAEPLRAMAPYLHAANIDLKFADDALYREICGARLQPVLDSIRLHHELGIWIEIATLVIPTYNDTDDALRRIAGFIAGVSPYIPWHVTAFYPRHRMENIPPTGPSVLRKARAIGLDAGLKYVYIGNLPDEEGGTTRCAGCGEEVITRARFRVSVSSLSDGACPRCGRRVEGVWR